MVRAVDFVGVLWCVPGSYSYVKGPPASELPEG